MLFHLYFHRKCHFLHGVVISFVTSTFLVRSADILANIIAVNIPYSKSLSPLTKSVLIKLFGARNLLTCPVLRNLAHEGIITISFNGPIAKDSTAKILGWCTNLESLVMPGNSITSAGERNWDYLISNWISLKLSYIFHVGFLGLFPRLPYLQNLDVSHSVNHVNDQILSSLVTHCKCLKCLNLNHCCAITDKGLHQLLKLPDLEELKISGCTGLSYGGVVHLRFCSGSAVLTIFSDFPSIDSLYLMSNQ